MNKICIKKYVLQIIALFFIGFYFTYRLTIYLSDQSKKTKASTYKSPVKSNTINGRISDKGSIDEQIFRAKIEKEKLKPFNIDEFSACLDLLRKNYLDNGIMPDPTECGAIGENEQDIKKDLKARLKAIKTVVISNSSFGESSYNHLSDSALNNITFVIDSFIDSFNSIDSFNKIKNTKYYYYPDKITLGTTLMVTGSDKLYQFVIIPQLESNSDKIQPGDISSKTEIGLGNKISISFHEINHAVINSCEFKQFDCGDYPYKNQTNVEEIIEYYGNLIEYHLSTYGYEVVDHFVGLLTNFGLIIPYYVNYLDSVGVLPTNRLYLFIYDKCFNYNNLFLLDLYKTKDDYQVNLEKISQYDKKWSNSIYLNWNRFHFQPAYDYYKELDNLPIIFSDDFFDKKPPCDIVDSCQEECMDSKGICYIPPNKYPQKAGDNRSQEYCCRFEQ